MSLPVLLLSSMFLKCSFYLPQELVCWLFKLLEMVVLLQLPFFPLVPGSQVLLPPLQIVDIIIQLFLEMDGASLAVVFHVKSPYPFLAVNFLCFITENVVSTSYFAAPTHSGTYFQLAAASDVCKGNTTSGLLTVESCQETEPFIRTLVHGKIVICTYTFDFESETASIATVADTIQKVGAAGFVLTMDPDIGSEQIKGATMTLSVPGLILNNMEASTVSILYP